MMARNLYRFYLYVVFVAMLIFATAGLLMFLQSLFSLTGLRGSYSSVPTSATVTQAGVFFGVSWFIAALIGGLHYWLIRRDMRSDLATGGSNAIRSFFLNVTELIAAPVAIGTGATTISQLGQSNDVTYGLAITLATLALVGVLEWERRRATAGTAVGLFFQRFSLYGIQFILLIELIINSTQALNMLVDALFFGGTTYRAFNCGDPLSVGCQGPNALIYVAAALWVALFWVAFGLAGRKGAGSLLQRIAYFISFAIGVIFTLYGVGQAIALAILNFSGTHVATGDVVQTYNFTASLVVGLLVVAVYMLWLRSATSQQSIPSVAWQTALSIEEAIVAGLMAFAFYTGVAAVLLNLFESPVSITTWSGPLASLITGIGYIAFDIHLSRRWKQDVPGAREARRGFVFALLGAGVLATAIGGAFALYAVISNALGSPLDNWQHPARVGAAAVAVGLVILVVYFVLANREKLLVRVSKSVPPAGEEAKPALTEAQTVPVTGGEPVKYATVEDVLDELLTGKLSRDEAAARIREIV
jgi:hypothetical protein